MKLGIILTDHNVNKIKYLSAGGILSEIINRHLDIDVFIIYKKNSNIKYLYKKILILLKKIIYKFVWYELKISYNPFCFDKKVSSKKIYSSFINYIGEKNSEKYYSILKNYINKNPNKVFYTKDLTDKNFLKILKTLELDMGVERGGGILKDSFVDHFRLGVLNLHGGGPLPFYRGLGAVEFALINQSKILCNVHFVDSGIDTGPILLQDEVMLTGQENLSDIYALITIRGIDSIVDSIQKLLVNEYIATKQLSENGRQHFLPHPFFENLALNTFKSKV